MTASEPPRSCLPPLRIALLGYRSHPHVGGQGIYLHYLSKALTQLGHRVDVLSGPPYPQLDERVRLIKIPSLDLYASDNPLLEWRAKHLLSWTDSYEYWSKMTGGFAEPYTFSRRAYRYLADHRGDYDLVHDNQCLGSGLLDIPRLGLPLVTTIHHPVSRDRDFAVAHEPRWFYRLMTRRWYRFTQMQAKVVPKLDHIVTVSEQSRSDICAAYGIAQGQVSIIANGVDTEFFSPSNQIARQPLRLISTASSDQPLKGQKFLLHALAQLRQITPEIKLIIIGQYQAGGDTAKQIEALDLASSIEFKSGLTTPELVDEYRRASVAITPSLYEGFGMPALEAMACGTPVITTDGGALPEVVGNAGVIVPAGDTEALATAIAHLLANKTARDRLSDLGLLRVEANFSWHAAATAMTRYYRKSVLTEHAHH